jgi:organic radical activating enzyme
VWAGRRQLFVRFAGEGETATIYAAQTLADDLRRQAAQRRVHSVTVSGRDPLGSAAFLAATFFAYRPELPVMLDTDGQRPEAIPGLRQYLTLVQVTIDFPASKPIVDRAVETLSVAAGVGHMHALVLAPRADTPEPQLLRVIEQANRASDGTMIVIHPDNLTDGGQLERRWSELMDHALAVHGDVRIALRLPPPAGMR